MSNRRIYFCALDILNFNPKNKFKSQSVPIYWAQTLWAWLKIGKGAATGDLGRGQFVRPCLLSVLNLPFWHPVHPFHPVSIFCQDSHGGIGQDKQDLQDKIVWQRFGTMRPLLEHLSEFSDRFLKMEADLRRPHVRGIFFLLRKRKHRI